MIETYSVWLGHEASIWSHNGYTVHDDYVLCDDLPDARSVVSRTFGNVVEVDAAGGIYCYRTQSDADGDQTGADAIAVVCPILDDDVADDDEPDYETGPDCDR